MPIPKKPSVEDTRITHKKCVYSDTEFVVRAQDIATSLGINPENPIESIKHRDKEYFIIGKEAERIASDEDVIQLEKLASDYSVDFSDVIVFLNGSYQSPIYEYVKPRVEVKFFPPEGIRITVPPDATKQDIINQLGKVKKLQKLFYKTKKTKRKPPENYRLIYAIFRARANNIGFESIFKQYSKGDLPHYDTPITHQSSDSLERYYRKYKPTTDT